MSRLKQIIFLHSSQSDKKDKISFGAQEWSGAVGDLGTLLPLAFGLVVFNNFPVGRLFLLWGIMYVVSGWYFKIPVSVQPLKAMSVLAIAQGFSPELLSSTSVFFGCLLLILVASKLIAWLKRIFTPGVTIGIQVGIGLILAHKAITLVIDHGWLIHSTNDVSMGWKVLLVFVFLAILVFLRSLTKIPGVLLLILGSVIVGSFFSTPISLDQNLPLMHLALPKAQFISQALLLLIIPQLPLTLGNAIYSASDVSFDLWKERAVKATPTHLATSIGLGNIFIGLLGGFPMCHGAGGMVAHAQFGGKTGGTTIILGIGLVILALIPGLTNQVFLIPIPILAGLLMFTSWRMIIFSFKAEDSKVLVIIILTASISFLTRNLAIALLVGKGAEYLLTKFQNRNSSQARRLIL